MQITTKKLIIMKKEIWMQILQIVITVLAALGTALGVTSCI